MLIAITVKPGSKNPGVERTGDELVVRVRERAVEGAANDACLRAIARHFGVAVRDVTLVRGTRSRRKVVRVGV
ncbi:MAG: DUF167 domain-containing protein [Candidatus Eremiobacteraeota bacterium]|nr:DUF167 domain-containing protein [Candidatus Eremiobacteraeota bacterium]MBV8332625.1 DUF167 domain-containing protein [Candidatus Eremiobacteraeota bacterium]MBV8432793.1 DUF167 domain-containing protein [Candidatus Eremiobacteraeota bacterium]MBV8722900.1 DUF167 domain-containing protein [Candidatus Eremiobacteraeota bacterium]